MNSAVVKTIERACGIVREKNKKKKEIAELLGIKYY
jgi:hypothetical protein